MKVYLVFDEDSQNDGYACNYGVFKTKELAKKFIRKELEDEEQENAQIEEFELVSK